MMNANDVIESYMADVAAQLPRKQRNDVAFELRALLQDELAAKAAEQGHTPDKAMAMALIAGFGRPAEVASRYAPQPPLIDPADNHNLLIWAIVGAVILHGRDIFWLAWMGLLLLIFATMACVRRRWPKRLGWRPRRFRDPDAASRWGFAVSFVLTLIFPLALYVAPDTFPRVAFLELLPTSGLALTASFLDSWQRVAVITCLVPAAVIYAVLALQGRFRPWSRWSLIVVNLCLGTLLVMHAAPMTGLLTGEKFVVFTSNMANQIAAPYFLLAGAITLLSALYEACKEWARVRPAARMQTVT